MSEEFLELLWVLEATLAMEQELEHVLDAATSGPCFRANELPQPKPEEQRSPKPASKRGNQMELIGESNNNAT